MKTIRKMAAMLLLGSLAYSASAVNCCHGVTPERLASTRAKVWAKWVKDWQKSDQLDAFHMTPIADGAKSSWVLPDSMEANAVMDFYSGVKGDRPAEGYPFFLYLHGSGPRDQEWSTGLALAQRFDDAPSAYLIPCIPNEGKYYRWWHRSKQWAWEHMLRRILTDPNIDASRIYWFGISEGGYGSQRLASFYADYLAAAGPMAGGEPLRNAPAENLSHTPLSLITGDQDYMFYRNILTPRTGERLDSLERLYPGEYQHRVMLEEGHGHPVTYGMTTPWLKQFSREAQPKHFRWENFEMHGRKRNAFYNLEVLSEPISEALMARVDTTEQAEDPAKVLWPRRDYEFRVKDNVVQLTVRDVEYIITERDPHYGIELNNTRRYTEAEHGAVRVYLSEELVDLTKPVSVYVNGHLVALRKPRVSKKAMRQACECFGDPMRLFPAAIVAEW